MSVFTAVLIGLATGIVFGFALEKSRVFERGVIDGQMQLRTFIMLKIFLAAVITRLSLAARDRTTTSVSAPTWVEPQRVAHRAAVRPAGASRSARPVEDGARCGQSPRRPTRCGLSARDSSHLRPTSLSATQQNSPYGSALR